MPRKNNKSAKKMEKSIAKVVERKDRSYLEEMLASALPSDEVAALAADAVGFGLDAASAFDPTPISGIALGAARAFGLLVPNPKHQPYSPKYAHPAVQRAKVPATGKPTLRRGDSFIHSVMLPRRINEYSKRRRGIKASLGATGVPFRTAGGVGLAQYHEAMPLTVKGAAGEWHAVESRQFIGRVPDTALAGELLASIPLDLTQGPLATTRLATLTHLYDRIKWNHVALVYVPTCSAATEGAVTLASWTDPTRTLADYEEGSDRINAALTMERNVVNSQLWEPTGLMPDEIETPRFQSTKGFANEDDELRFQAAARLEAMALSSWTLTSSPGLLYIEASVIAQNDIVVPGKGPAPGKDHGEGTFFYCSENSGVTIGGETLGTFWGTANLIPVGPTPKGDGTTTDFSLDRAAQPNDFDATGQAKTFRLGSGLAAVGASHFKLVKDVSNPIAHELQFKLPFGVWFITTTMGFNGTAGLNKVQRLVFAANVAGGTPGTATALGTPMVNGFGQGVIVTSTYSLESSIGADSFKMTATGGIAFTVSDPASISVFGMCIHRNGVPDADAVLFDSYVARKMLRDPTAAQELSAREKDAGEASYANEVASPVAPAKGRTIYLNDFASKWPTPRSCADIRNDASCIAVKYATKEYSEAVATERLDVLYVEALGSSQPEYLTLRQHIRRMVDDIANGKPIV